MPLSPDVQKEYESIDGNSANIHALVQQVRSSRGVIPFVGAGMSVPFGYPQWKEFLLGQARSDGLRARVTGLLEDGDYEGAAQALQDAVGADTFQSTVDATFAPARLPRAAPDAAVYHLSRVCAGPIVTTNFDRVLEEVFDQTGRGFDPHSVIAGASTDRIRDALNQNRHALIKVHGDAGDRRDRVFTTSDYQRSYAGDHPLRRVLGFAMTQPLLFLGCSLDKDRTVTVLEELSKQIAGLLNPFAVLELPRSEPDRHARSVRLRDLGVRVIWFPPGRFDLIAPLLAYLGDEADDARAALATARQVGARVLHLDVPRSPSVWRGRTAELARISDALDTSRVVVIEGARGTGKTALALRTVDDALEARRFGAIAWTTAKAAPISLAEVLDRISLTLDFPHTLQLPLPKKEDVLIAELERKGISLLLVVDNFEHVTDAGVISLIESKLPRLCTILVTCFGHAPLHGEDVTIVKVDDLPREDAVELFRARADTRGLDPVSDAELDDLYDVVHGNPLAIEWVVGQMRHRHLELNWIVADLRAGTGDLFDDLFSSAWTALPASAHAALYAMSLFATDANDTALQAISGLDRDAFRQGVAALRAIYLLKRVEAHGTSVPRRSSGGYPTRAIRFGVHPLTREFTRVRLEASEHESAISDRFTAYFHSLMQQHGGSPEREGRSDLLVVDAERANILAAVELSYARESWDAFLALMEAIVRWLFINGSWSRLELWATRGLEVARPRGRHGVAARMLSELGRVYSQRGDDAGAEATLLESLREAEIAGDDRTLGYTCHHLGELRSRQGRYDDAETYLGRSLAHFEAAKTTRDIIGVRYRLAELAFRRQRWADAKVLFEAGLEDTRREKWERLESYHLNFLGDLARREGKLDEARGRLARAFELVPETDTRRLASLERSMAELEHAAGRSAEALASARRARDHFRKLGMVKEQDDTEQFLALLERTAAG